MTSMRDAFRLRLLDWMGPVGPFTTEAEDEELQRVFVKRLAPSQLGECIQEAASWLQTQRDYKDLNLGAIRFAQLMRADGRGNELAKAVLLALNAKGPPVLVDMWGYSQVPAGAPQVLSKVDWQNADAELQIALADALMFTPGPGVLEALREMKLRPQSAEARQEIDLAITTLEGGAPVA